MNEISKSDVYADAGVDITAGYKAVELMKKHIARTLTSGVCSDVGGFGGLFELDLTGISKPVLVSGTDGVGTKLKIAFLMDKHDTVGIDCVAMCVNDIICCGSKASVLPRLHSLWQELSRKDSGHCQRRLRGLRSVGRGAHRRRDRGDARILSDRRIRPRGLLHGRCRQGQNY